MYISPASHPRYLLSLVVPTYNEGNNIVHLIKTIADLLDHLLPDRYELIIVDDDSPDRTWEIAQSLQNTYPHLQVLRRTQERGLATAVIRGWQAAQGEILGVIDGDLQHPPETIVELYQAITQGADLAVASRYAQGASVGSWSGIRHFLSRGAVRLALWILPEIASRLSDPMSGFFLVRRSALAESELSPIGYKILLEVVSRGNIPSIHEVAYTFLERQEGSSKVTWRQYVEFIGHLFRLRLATGSGAVAPIGRFLRFALVGLTGVGVDTCVLFLCSYALGFPMAAAKTDMAQLQIFMSKAVAVEIAIVNNFIWNDQWTFRDASLRQIGWKAKLRRFLGFNLACIIGAILNIGLFLLLIQGGLQFLPANLIAIVLSTAWNYWINLKLNWKTQ